MEKIPFIFFCILLFIACGPSNSVLNSESEKNLTDTEKTFQKALQASRRGNIAQAHKLYNQIIEKDPDYIEAYLMKGGLFYESKQWDSARKTFLNALEVDQDYNPEVYYSLTLIEIQEKNYAAGVNFLSEYLDRIKENHPKYEKASELLISLSFKADAVANPVDFKKELLPFPINTDNSEYVPQFTADGKQLIFVRRIRQQEDLYISTFTNNKFSMPQLIKEISTPENEGVHTISADGRTLIFTGCNRRDSYGSCDLYYTRKKADGTWSIPSNMGIAINSISWDAQPSLSADGKTLYFSSARAGSIGGRDIWVTKRDKAGRWQKPRNLSGIINTLGNDETPFIHADGLTLYFRSNGRVGMGGYDMYWSQYDPEIQDWTVPENLGYPINTEADQGGLSIDIQGNTAYYSSNENGKDVDIFKFDLPEELRPTVVTYLSGTVLDKENRIPLQGNIAITGYNQKEIWNLKSDGNGNFLHALPVGESYGITIEKEGYLFYSDFIGLDSVFESTQPFEKLFLLTPLKTVEDIEETIVLNNIFFESGSSRLKEESDLEISRLANLLRKNPQWNIEIIGHTDNVGSTEDNLQLSINRAQVVVNALVGKGIAPSLLSFSGEGELSPIASNETSEGRQMNRRTEFKITKFK